jgi:hypothetical protein
MKLIKIISIKIGKNFTASPHSFLLTIVLPFRIDHNIYAVAKKPTIIEKVSMTISPFASPKTLMYRTIAFCGDMNALTNMIYWWSAKPKLIRRPKISKYNAGFEMFRFSFIFLSPQVLIGYNLLQRYIHKILPGKVVPCK